MREKGLVHLVAIAEFDEDRGIMLRARYPPDQDIAPYTEEDLANFVIPLQDYDIPYMVLNINGETIFGMGYFKRKTDKSLKRSTRQASCLVLARQPYFDLFEPFLVDGVMKFMDEGLKDKGMLQTLFTTLNDVNTKTTLTIWNKSHTLTLRQLQEDEFGSISLMKLVELFQTDTMLLWYSLLRQERILFSGSPAVAVGNFCLAAPLLVAPIRGFTANICPYFPLVLLNRPELDIYTTKSGCIFGATNPIFEQMSHMYDVLAMFSSSVCVIHNAGIKVSSVDKDFIRCVLSGIHDRKGENWVRQQFRSYTEKFLERVASNHLSDHQRKLLATDRAFSKTTLYLNYLRVQASASPLLNVLPPPVELLDAIAQSPEGLQRQRNLSYLDAACAGTPPPGMSTVNIADIDELVDHDVVSVITPLIFGSNSTERKYAINIIASIATTIKGQVSILANTTNFVKAIIDIARDTNERPNVIIAASCFLLKMSSLNMGAREMIENDAINILTEIVCTNDFNNLNFKRNAASALLNIFRLFRDESPPKLTFEDQLKSTDLSYTSIILQLMDLLCVTVEGMVPPSPEVTEIIKALEANIATGLSVYPDIQTRSSATGALQAELVRSPFLMLQFIEAGGLKLLWENQSLAVGFQDSPEMKLHYLSWDVICMVADTHIGACAIVDLRIVDQAIESFDISVNSFQLSRVLRFFEVVAQQRMLAPSFIRLDGLQVLISVILAFYDSLPLVCVAALSALRYLVRFHGEHHPQMFKRELSRLVLLASNQQRDQRLLRTLLGLCVTGPSPDVEITEIFQPARRKFRVLDAQNTPQ
eukprot:c8294_g1_i3.p1 GENE.c8294_g1_i3~~c8294_g1_i3.p1  ORF type:complete len:817 (-),score=204.76 c8294_g1_i3:255-2705(-)